MLYDVTKMNVQRTKDYLSDTYNKHIDNCSDMLMRVRITRRVLSVLHFHPALAPFKAAVLPLSKKLGDKAMEIHNNLAKHFAVDYDETGSIGKRYRREDEIGTPFCITYDFDSETDGCVTVRDRDTMQQERIKIENLVSYIEAKLEF